MFRDGDRVCYTIEHEDWLRRAGRWLVKKHAAQFVGTVVGDAEGDVVIIRWDAGKPWPNLAKKDRPGNPATHAAWNLRHIKEAS